MGPQNLHPAVFDLSVLIDAEDDVITLLFAQQHQKLDMSQDLIWLIHTKFN